MEMKLLSFNIRFDNPHDGAHAWPHRRDFLSSIINEFAPDIMGTQEGRKPQLMELGAKLKGLSIIDHHRDWIEDRMYPTLFYNSKRFELLKSGDIWLSETPYEAGSSSFESAFPRLCTWANFKCRHSSLRFCCANVHLDHVRESTRLAQAKVLASEISKHSKGTALILMGDFNSAPSSLVRNQLLRELRDLRDPWEFLGQPETPSYHNFGPIPADATRIDWFLISERFKPLAIELDQVSQGELWPSDHYPLKLTIETDAP